jgi:hypothetical protein
LHVPRASNGSKRFPLSFIGEEVLEMFRSDLEETHEKNCSRFAPANVLSLKQRPPTAKIMTITETMNTRKIGTWILLAILGVGMALPSYADRVPSQKAQARAVRKMQKRQNKANRKYAKAQRKAQRRMLKTERKNTHLPGQRR